MGKIDLQRIMECGADFFVTGNEYVRDSLNLKFIPLERLNRSAYGGGSIIDLKFNPYVPDNVHRGGKIILADANQDLAQSYSIAKNVFEHDESGLIKFVLIGLSPYILSQNNAESLVAWDVKKNVQLLEDYFKLCLDNGAKPVVIVLPVESSLKKNYNADALKTFRDTINQVVKKFQSSAFIDLLDISIANACFQDKTHLNSEGAAAVSALLGSRLYFKGILSPKDLCAADDDFFYVLSKYFPVDPDSRKKYTLPSEDKPLIHYIFSIMACEDFKRLSKTISRETAMDLMARVFFELTYSYLAILAELLPKEDYNELTIRIFNMTVERIRRKNKIKVGFHFEFSSHWCGDDLYNSFAKDERFEPTVFVPINSPDKSRRDEFLKDIKKFKARGLNVFEMNVNSLDVPKPDILFRFVPYPVHTLPAFRLVNLKIKETLLVHFSYSFSVANSTINIPLYKVLWKNFFSSIIDMERCRKLNKISTPREIYSGYPRTDVFFNKNINFHFDWKMACHDTKKIIWAPHWSIDGGFHVATFQWNYQFMYEFAKAHPEISWLVKPHPALFGAAVRTNIFASAKELNEYFSKWDNLPNARFYTGTYYQDIFATSDGMIQDCGSFVAEYQYVDKPMIFLTRKDGGKFNELGEEILKASYLVDGKDLDAIAKMMQRVFIEGDDYKAAERKAVFDKYLNYPKYTGMLASEFIYKNIADDLKAVPT